MQPGTLAGRWRLHDKPTPPDTWQIDYHETTDFPGKVTCAVYTQGTGWKDSAVLRCRKPLIQPGSLGMMQVGKVKISQHLWFFIFVPWFHWKVERAMDSLFLTKGIQEHVFMETSEHVPVPRVANNFV